MIKENKRIMEIIEQEKVLDLEKKALFERITKDLLRIQKIKGKLFYRIIRNDIVHIRKTVEGISDLFKLNEVTVKDGLCKKNGKYFSDKILANIEKLKVVDYCAS